MVFICEEFQNILYVYFFFEIMMKKEKKKFVTVV